MASNSRFRLSANDLPTPTTPIHTYSPFLSSNSASLSYNFTTTPYALNTLRAQTATPCPQVRRKRKKENQPLSDVLPTLNSEEPVRKKQSYGPRRSTADKLATVFNAIRDANWTLGEFLYYTFQTKDKNGQDLKRTTQHSMYATHFLQGQTTYTPGIILECWYNSPDGRVHGQLAQEVPMYATTLVYTKIKPARAALTAFAAQIVEKKLVQEARKAVLPESGLHATSKRRGTHKVEWADVGASTVSHVEAVIKHYQPLTWRLLNRIAGEKDVDGAPAVRKRRLTSTVLGSVWVPPPVFESSQPEVKKCSKKEKPTTRHPQGDRVLANSITFMRDALMSREMSYAIAEGDPGRVYEVMKVLLFTFTGSSHTKYSSYLLETICRLELESTQALRETILRTTLVNLTGRAGSFSAADLMQEYFNRLLEAIVEKKGVEYGDSFIRKVISRNLHHFARIKLDLRVGVGLSQRSSGHSAPHLNPETRILLETYNGAELHFRRPGRVYIDTDKDQFDGGIVKFRAGKLKKWISDTTKTRNLQSSMECPVSEEGEYSDDDGEDNQHEGAPDALVFREVVDGQLVLGSVETSALEVDTWISQLEEIPVGYSSNEESDE
ncbi:hypothetical protein B0H34DRAFT_797474 [Crassisporium funariophilum]|nr:hypothetical protein B0H34DRAFT_797474 [Crassisporium funariophilum]